MKKPRIAIYYSNIFGRNDGPPLYYFEALKRLGYDTTHLLAEGDTRKYGKFDLHFWVDWGEDGLPWQEWYPPKDGGKTVYIASDTHLDDGYRLKKATNFTYVFFNQKSARDTYMQTPFPTTGAVTINPHPHIVEWLPHAGEPVAYPHTTQAKKYDVCFIGHVQETPNIQGMTRVDTLDTLFKAFPNFYFGTRSPQKPGVNMFEDAARKFNQSRIVFNISIKDDINMRVFETLMAGGFLLTNRLPTLPALFTEGVHYVGYDSMDEAVEKATYYLAHDEERERIAECGHKEAMAKHTYEARVKTIMKSLSL